MCHQIDPRLLTQLGLLSPPNSLKSRTFEMRFALKLNIQDQARGVLAQAEAVVRFDVELYSDADHTYLCELRQSERGST